MPKGALKQNNRKPKGRDVESEQTKPASAPVQIGQAPQRRAEPKTFEPEPFPVEWIEIIRERYFTDRWTPYWLAAASGVSDSQIIRFFRGERDLRFQTAERLCRALGLDLTFRPVAAPPSDIVTRSRRPKRNEPRRAGG